VLGFGTVSLKDMKIVSNYKFKFALVHRYAVHVSNQFFLGRIEEIEEIHFA